MLSYSSIAQNPNLNKIDKYFSLSKVTESRKMKNKDFPFYYGPKRAGCDIHGR